MPTIEELIQKAQAAIAAGKLDEAETFTKQAKALKALADLQPAPAVESTELVELRAMKAKLDAEPATKKAGYLVVTEDETDKKAAMPWKSLGDQLKAIADAAITPHRMDERLKAQKAILGASEGVPADGGFLVQPNFAAEIFQLAHDGGEILNRVRRLPVGANANGLTINAVDETSRATGSRWGGVQAYWAAEGQAVTATKPKFRQMELKLNKLMAVMYATDELLADTTALGAVAQQSVSEEMIWLTENAIVRGTGAGQPKGIIGDLATVSVAKEVGQAAATVVVQNFAKMWGRMWARSRRNAVWLLNQDVEAQLMLMDFPIGTGGVSVFLPPGGLSATPYSTLLGRPVLPVEYASTLGTVGDVILFDPTQYLMIDKGGVKAEESMHVAFLTDQMTYRWTYRVDGQLGWRSALTPANGTNTLSPVVTLDTRS